MVDEFRVVLASPSDVEAERDKVARVVTELNKVTAPFLGVRVALSRWETDVAPGMDTRGPQGLVDRALRIEDADVFIGIFWRRFGTPVPDARSGTEHEILRAFDNWKRTGRPRIMMYFCQRPFAPTNVEETEQWGRVLEFKAKFPREGLYWPYTTVSSFESLVRLHLTQVLLDSAGPVAPQRRALQGILGTIGQDGRPLIFVYSSTNVEHFVDYDGKVIDFPFSKDELRVTAIPDAQGIGTLHKLLASAGKRRHVEVTTADRASPDWWRQDMILVGSKNANPVTEEALQRYDVPFRFTPRVDGIADRREGEKVSWPRPGEDLGRSDYALLVKMTESQAGDLVTHLVCAGIGGIGTLAACYYLDRNAPDLFSRYGSEPFACVLFVPDKRDYTAVECVAEVVLNNVVQKINVGQPLEDAR